MLASYKKIVPPPTQQQILTLSGLPRLKNCSWYSLERSSGSWYNRGITTKCSTSGHLRHLRQEMGWCKEISISRFLRSSFSFTVFLCRGLIFARSCGSVIVLFLSPQNSFPITFSPKYIEAMIPSPQAGIAFPFLQHVHGMSNFQPFHCCKTSKSSWSLWPTCHWLEPQMWPKRHFRNGPWVNYTIASMYGLIQLSAAWLRLGKIQVNLGGGFKYFLFSPLFGEDSHFD